MLHQLARHAQYSELPGCSEYRLPEALWFNWTKRLTARPPKAAADFPAPNCRCQFTYDKNFHCRSTAVMAIEWIKAWSQNIGHEEMLRTPMSYGTGPATGQAELVRGLGEKKVEYDDAQLTAMLAEVIRKRKAKF
ncbi:hypothetical protein [Altererythrobacter lutimaris]|uniref:Uncharacterized protein n=1 Tax=Altererythrobacter lutimaris TaxID=2743979 RepID=A0A850H8S0_9SPHN|nr:hypothetical protein [Altererythrobacter lutimaris]NVE95547.1 hypothetical protein [Altererythrobacter lutimaris]